MRKYIYKSIAVTLLILVGSGCNRFLDEIPNDRTIINTPEEIKKLLPNAYPESTPAIVCEFSSDNIDDIGENNPYFTYFYQELADWREPLEYSNNDDLSAIWRRHYRAIAHSNEILKQIEKIGNLPSLSAVKGEALVARAYAHFVLINVFTNHYNAQTSATDLGLPYMVTQETELAPEYERGNVAEFYQKIDQDLQEGLPLIDDNLHSGAVAKYHFNRKAAYAFAARFYLYYEKWEKAVECATEVLGATPTDDMLRDWSVFRTISSRTNYQAQEYTSETSPANLMLQNAQSGAPNVLRGSAIARYSHSERVAVYETFRGKNIWGESGYNAYYFRVNVDKATDYSNRITFSKYPRFSSSSSRTVTVPFTTEETLLVRAEANILLKNYDAAVADLNVVSQKVLNPNYTTNGQVTFTQQEIVDYYNTLAYSTADEATQKKKLDPKFTLDGGVEQENLLHYVLQWRRILTMHEGLRWFDVRRYGIEVNRFLYDNVNKRPEAAKVKETLPNGDLRRTIQLPQAVISAKMTPNPR